MRMALLDQQTWPSALDLKQRTKSASSSKCQTGHLFFSSTTSIQLLRGSNYSHLTLSIR